MAEGIGLSREKPLLFRDGGVTQLLLRAENRILRHLEDAELNHGFAGNIDLLFVEGLIPVRAFLFCFTSFPNPGTTNSPSFWSFVGNGAERIKEYAGVFFIRLRSFGKCALKL